jgi:hypothetical protein
MIVLFTAYCLLVGAGIVLIARLIDMTLRAFGRPTRFVWLGAMALTVGITIVAAWANGSESLAEVSWLLQEGVGFEGPILASAEMRTAALARGVELPTRAQEIHGAVFVAASQSDEVVTTLSLVLTVGWLGLLALSTARVRHLRQSWRSAVVNDTDVLVSAETGPAIFGVLRPRIVIPRWVEDLTGEQRRMVVEHEREHVHAGDSRTLAAGAALVAITPLNVALWYMLRSLREAVEMDCDQRVLARDNEPAAYGALLLAVGERTLGGPRPLVALVESKSLMVRRIEAMVARPSGNARARALGCSVAALIIATMIACVPHPSLQRTQEYYVGPWGVAGPFPPEPKETWTPRPTQVVVTDSVATVYLPMEPRKTYQWNLAEDSIGAVEYVFDLHIYEPGLGINVLVKKTGEPRTGDLAALLREARPGVSWRIDEPAVDTVPPVRMRRPAPAQTSSVPVLKESDGPFGGRRPHLTATALNDSTVLLTLRDTLFQRMLFSKRPREASYQVRTPWHRRGSNKFSSARIVTIPIVYRP